MIISGSVFNANKTSFQQIIFSIPFSSWPVNVPLAFSTLLFFGALLNVATPTTSLSSFT